MSALCKKVCKTIRGRSGEIQHFRGFRGCSSMVEQQLPKLLTSAEIQPQICKTWPFSRVLNQSLSGCAQNKLAPSRRQSERGHHQSRGGL